jgi:hypothetical protein
VAKLVFPNPAHAMSSHRIRESLIKGILEIIPICPGVGEVEGKNAG